MTEQSESVHAIVVWDHLFLVESLLEEFLEGLPEPEFTLVGSRFFELVHAERREEVLSSIFAIFAQIAEDHRSIETCSAVCTLWRCVARHEDLWSEMCKRLWSAKVYVPGEFQVLRAEGHARDACIGSYIGSKRTTMNRVEITSLSFSFQV